MRLVELDPQFLRYEPEGERIIWRQVDSMNEAHGVQFLCPKCFAANRGPAGTHRVISWSRERGTPEEAEPGPGRWQMAGTGFADLSLVPDLNEARDGRMAHSVALIGGCAWHGFVTNGEVTLC